MGRFLTPDWAATPVPIPYAVMGNPQTLNLYSYVENNPITGTDPDGHACAKGSNCPDQDDAKDDRQDSFQSFLDKSKANLSAMGASASSFVFGMGNALSNDFAGAQRVESNNTAMTDGQRVGDAAAVVLGTVGTGLALLASATADIGSGGTAVLTISVQVAAVAIPANGALNGLKNLTAPMQSSEPPQLAAGKQAHKAEPVRPGEKPEVTTPSGKGRMDRYNAGKAHIREIKPGNTRGVKAGSKQLERYKREMDAATGRNHSTELTTY